MRLKGSLFLLLVFSLITPLLITARQALAFPQGDESPGLETKRLEIADCINFRYPNTQLVIKDDTTLKSLVRDDLSRERCLASLKDIDFNKRTLVGMELNTGWCRVPLLTYRVTREDEKKRYLLSVGYHPPVEPCRALSRYEFWLLVPKLPEQYEMEFEVKEGERWMN